MNINDFFDKIYIINLEESTDRKKNIISQMKKNKIKNYKFINTIPGHEINKDELMKDKKWAFPGNKFFCDKECSCKAKGHKLSNNQISLHLNHFNIWNDIVKNKYKKCLILEDDCIFTENINDFNEIIQYIPINWKLLYLGHSNKISRNNSEYENNLFKKLKWGINETHIYAISLDCAKIFIENTFPIRAAVDGFIAHFMINKKKINNIYIYKKTLGINGSLKKVYQSTIN